MWIHVNNVDTYIFTVYCRIRDRNNKTSISKYNMGIDIKETNAGIGILASIISIWYWTKQMPDCVSLVRYRTVMGLTVCRGSPAFRHSHSFDPKILTRDSSQSSKNLLLLSIRFYLTPWKCFRIKTSFHYGYFWHCTVKNIYIFLTSLITSAWKELKYE
jgi:hypothetical protein